MPKIILSRQYGVSDADIKELIPHLLAAVARNLSCVDPSGDGNITPEDIEVVNRIFDPNLDVTQLNLVIEVEANDFPDRRATLKERQTKIIEQIMQFLPKQSKVGIWIKLFPAVWGEIKT